MGIYDFDVTTIDGARQSMALYHGHVLLIVNLASKCGFTPQYAGLELLYQKYKSRDFTILGFPCNQFLGQEPGDEAQIKSFCSLTYNVTFPLFSKIAVNGKNTDPLFQFLKSAKRGWFGSETIKWNFTKFLVGRDGAVRRRFGPTEKPESIENFIVPLLDEADKIA